MDGSSSGGGMMMAMHSISQPGTPGGGGGGPHHHHHHMAAWGAYCHPSGHAMQPYSPTALQIAAASGALGSDPSTPVRGGRPGSVGGGGSGSPFLAVMPDGSPVMVSPGQMMFTQVGGVWAKEGGDAVERNSFLGCWIDCDALDASPPPTPAGCPHHHLHSSHAP